jgi:hypothetical protein
MTTAERERFINELVQSVKSEILSKVENMPNSWDGIEIRQYISDRFSEVVFKGTMSRSRKREYNNTLYTTNL